MKAIYFLIIAAFIGCTSSSSYEVKVLHKGALMKIMHQGDLGAKASLDTLDSPGLYAVGALDSLRGEVFIENGQPIISTAEQGSIQVRSAIDEKAALLVYAEVKSWKSIEVTTDDLEQILLETAEEHGLAKPFPFMLRGKFAQLDYHVIAYDPKTGDLSKHKEGAYRASLNNQQVVVLGFYSDQHHGVFTHHDSNMHMHVRNSDNSEMGHVDVLQTGESFTLLIPKS